MVLKLGVVVVTVVGSNVEVVVVAGVVVAGSDVVDVVGASVVVDVDGSTEVVSGCGAGAGCSVSPVELFHGSTHTYM